MLGWHTLDAGSAAATFRLHCITSLLANQCLLSLSAHAPLCHRHHLMSLSAPGASAAVTRNPLWVGGTGETEIGNLNIKAPSTPPRESSMSGMCVLFTWPPSDTVSSEGVQQGQGESSAASQLEHYMHLMVTSVIRHISSPQASPWKLGAEPTTVPHPHPTPPRRGLLGSLHTLSRD